MGKIVKARAVTAADVWQGKTNAERKAWLKRAGCSDRWDTTTYGALPVDVQAALAAAK